MMSPLEIQMTLHFYAIAEPFSNIGCQPQEEIVQKLLKKELITVTDKGSGYATTEKGNKLVDMLCDTPYPVVKYIDPRDF